MMQIIFINLAEEYLFRSLPQSQSQSHITTDN
jgi:hypothetical protein